MLSLWGQAPVQRIADAPQRATATLNSEIFQLPTAAYCGDSGRGLVQRVPSRNVPCNLGATAPDPAKHHNDMARQVRRHQGRVHSHQSLELARTGIDCGAVIRPVRHASSPGMSPLQNPPPPQRAGQAGNQRPVRLAGDLSSHCSSAQLSESEPCGGSEPASPTAQIASRMSTYAPVPPGRMLFTPALKQCHDCRERS